MLTRNLDYGPPDQLSSTRIPIPIGILMTYTDGWCVIVVLVDFEGGDACFPELGVKIDCTSGM